MANRMDVARYVRMNAEITLNLDPILSRSMLCRPMRPKRNIAGTSGSMYLPTS